MDLPTLPTYLFEPNLAGVLSLFLAVILPLLVGLAVKQRWSPGVKAVTLLGFAAVKSVVEAVVAGGAGFDLPLTIYTVSINFGIAVVVYFGFWKPTGTADVAQRSLNK